MSQAPDWSEPLRRALDLWSQGQLERANLGMEGVLQGLTSSDQGVWRALALNQLALLALQRGLWQEAQEYWQRSRELWWQLQGSFEASPQLAPTLAWYSQLLSHYGWEQRAQAVLATPLIDPWQEGSGALVESTSSWEADLSEAWRLARRSRWNEAQRFAARSEQQANPPQKALSLNSQAVFAYASGNYPEAEQLQAEAQSRWEPSSFASFRSLLSQSGWNHILPARPGLLSPDCLSQLGLEVVKPLEVVADQALSLPELPSTIPKVKKVPWGFLLLGLLILLAGWWFLRG